MKAIIDTKDRELKIKEDISRYKDEMIADLRGKVKKMQDAMNIAREACDDAGPGKNGKRRRTEEWD
jgi:hypothetical protein